MEDYSEITLRKICCTCLCIDRKLTRLCKLKDGINNLFFLLSYDSEAYKALFSKETTQLFICWECKALMRRLCRFRDQACVAQKQLLDITDGKINMKLLSNLSNLKWFNNSGYNICISYDTIENFIDCGPEIDNIKSETDINTTLDLDNSPIASVNEIEIENVDQIKVSEHKLEIKPLSLKRKFKKETIIKRGSVRKKIKSEEVIVKEEGYSRILMTDEEMFERIERKKLEDNYISAQHKCQSCVEGFKDKSELMEHNARLHVQKPKYVQCDICLVYIKFWWLPEHKNDHHLKYQCHSCDQVYHYQLDILTHLKTAHAMRSALAPGIFRKLKRKAMLTNPALMSPKIENSDNSQIDSQTGYKCPECNKCFENMYLRYKHILKTHREGHRCGTCGKTFAFKNTLNKHEQIHGEPQPREQCAVCGKMVRADRVKFHARIHGERKSFECISCDKRFVSHDSYEKHLKYSRNHAVRDVHKYKCSMCDKGFRTMRELNDHVNYNHMGKTQHKCPICHKALATRRCVTRHVSRAHHGIKEKSGDKILCQTCGKAFRDKKCLREHELIHTGEKPLSCDMCGRTFRQSACLYTHKRRVHKVAPKRLHVQHSGPEDASIDLVLHANVNVNNTEIK